MLSTTGVVSFAVVASFRGTVGRRRLMIPGTSTVVSAFGGGMKVMVVLSAETVMLSGTATRDGEPAL